MNDISLKNSEFDDLVVKNTRIEFKAKFDEKDYNFEIDERQLTSAQTVKVNGQTGMTLPEDISHLLWVM